MFHCKTLNNCQPIQLFKKMFLDYLKKEQYLHGMLKNKLQ